MLKMTNRQSASKQTIFKQLPIDLNGFESKYMVTNDGRVFSTYLNDFLKPFYSKGGYVRVKLNYGDRSKKFMIHRLVAMAFINNPDNKPCVDHIDRNRSNNNAENLQWVTSKENAELAVERGSKDTVDYIFTNIKTGETMHFTNRHLLIKKFGKICMRYVRQIAEGVRTPMSGMFADYTIERKSLKLQRPSLAREYTQVSGNGGNLTAKAKGFDMV